MLQKNNNQYFLPEQEQIMSSGIEIDEAESFGASNTDSQLSKYILETYDILEDLEQKLRGNVWNERLGRYVQKSKPLLKEEGVNRIVLLLSGFVNRHVALSNFNENEINRIAYETRITVVNLLRLNWDIWDVDKSNLDVIVRIIDCCIFSMLKRAYKGGERENLGKRYKHIEAPGPFKPSRFGQGYSSVSI